MKKQSGLTLIEVLIASMILFMALGLVSSVFQQNLRSQMQANKYLLATQSYMSIQAEIRFQLEQGTSEGSIQTPAGPFNWKAELEEQRQELADLSPEAMPGAIGGSLRLYKITVETENQFSFEFKQAVWSDKLV